MLRPRSVLFRSEIPWLAACLVLIAVAFLKATPFPTGDSAYFEFVGQQMLHGAQLYRDVWDNKLPSIYLTNELWQTILGEQYRLHVAAEIAIEASSAVLFALLLRKMSLRTWAPATLAFVALVIVLPSAYNQTEQYALPLSLLALLCLQYEKPIFCGVAFVAAVSYWIPAVLLVVPVVVWWRGDPKRLSRFFIAAAATAVAAVAIALATLGAAQLRALVQSWVLYVTEPAQMHHGKLGAIKSISISLREGLYISGIGILLPLYLVRLRRPQTRTQALVLWWSLAALAGAFSSTRFYSHYFFLAIPALIAAIVALPPRPVRWLNATALAVSAYFAIRSGQFMVHNASFERREVARIAHMTNRIEEALGPRAVIQAAEEPGLLLAAHARTRTPYDIASETNLRFVSQATRGNAYPETDVWLVTRADSTARTNGAHVCQGGQIDAWRLLVRAELASRFTSQNCPHDSHLSAQSRDSSNSLSR